jgi:hypothetical protein
MRNKIIAWLDIPRTLQEPFHALWNRTGELQGQICKLQEEAVLEDINCPVCKRVTLVKKIIPAYSAHYLNNYYCYGCGKQFEKMTEEQLVERHSLSDLMGTISASIVVDNYPDSTTIKKKGGGKKLGKSKGSKEPVKSGKK